MARKPAKKRPTRKAKVAAPRQTLSQKVSELADAAGSGRFTDAEIAKQLRELVGSLPEPVWRKTYTIEDIDQHSSQDGMDIDDVITYLTVAKNEGVTRVRASTAGYDGEEIEFEFLTPPDFND